MWGYAISINRKKHRGTRSGRGAQITWPKRWALAQPSQGCPWRPSGPRATRAPVTLRQWGRISLGHLLLLLFCNKNKNEIQGSNFQTPHIISICQNFNITLKIIWYRLPLTTATKEEDASPNTKNLIKCVSVFYDTLSKECVIPHSAV